MKKRVARIKTHRHAFKFQTDNGKVFTAWAKVKQAKSGAELVLTHEHVKKSIAIGGQGNTQKCAMAVCSNEHSKALGFEFQFVDWLYKRAYFVTKVNALGMPSECIVYTHNDNVAPMFDTPAGMKKLLKDLEKNGPRTVKLYPRKIYGSTKASGNRTTKTGDRNRTIKVKGAALRFARLRGGMTASVAA